MKRIIHLYQLLSSFFYPSKGEASTVVSNNELSKEDLVLKYIHKKGKGLEIGPSHNPLAPKRDGYQVEIIDHLSKADLLIKYQHHGLDLSQIEAVDYVWKGEKYTELTQKKHYYDWIIASHLIEHTTDLIGFLNDCSELLNEKGILFLVIPDKRFCFDHYRPISGLSKIIDQHLNPQKIHSPGAVAEYFLNVVAKNNHPCWDQYTSGDYTFSHTIDDAKQSMQNVIDNKVFLDIHAWCFVPHSFRLIINDLQSLKLTTINEKEFVSSSGCEFYMVLSKKKTDTKISRMELLEKIEAELKI